MKKSFALALMLICAMAVQGQRKAREARVEPIAMEVVPVARILENMKTSGDQLARLYRRPKARVKTALSFATPEDRPKVA